MTSVSHASTDDPGLEGYSLERSTPPHLGGWRMLFHNLKRHFVSSDKDKCRALVMPKKRDKNKKLLATGDRIALAFAALAILRLPEPLQQGSNARNMLDILAGEECWRQGHILHQAHHVLNTCTGFPLGDDNGASWDDDDVQALFDEAFGKRAELIAEEEAFRAPQIAVEPTDPEPTTVADCGNSNCP